MNTKKKEKTELIYYLGVKEDYIADMFSSCWFSVFATWVTDHRVNIYTLK